MFRIILGIAVLREFQGCKSWNLLSITVFCEVRPRNTVVLKFRELFTVGNFDFLSTTAFCEVQATKHCNAQKTHISNLNLTKHIETL